MTKLTPKLTEMFLYLAISYVYLVVAVQIGQSIYYNPIQPSLSRDTIK